MDIATPEGSHLIQGVAHGETWCSHGSSRPCHLGADLTMGDGAFEGVYWELAGAELVVFVHDFYVLAS